MYFKSKVLVWYSIPIIAIFIIINIMEHFVGYAFYMPYIIFALPNGFVKRLC